MTKKPSKKQTLILNLEQLLENHEGLNAASLFLQSEDVDWTEADENFVTSLESWMDIVESVLSSAGRVDDVENWRRARTQPITILNVYDHAERMKILLQSIKSRIEQDGGELVSQELSEIEIFQSICDAIEDSLLEKQFKDTALYDLEQAKLAYEVRAFKACVVMLGAVMEAIMLGTLRMPKVLAVIRNDTNPPGILKKIKGGIQHPTYSDDIAMADALANNLGFDDYRTLMDEYVSDIDTLKVEGIQRFRNAIHPWMVIQKPNIYADYNRERALNHLSSLKLIVDHIFSWLHSLK